MQALITKEANTLTPSPAATPDRNPARKTPLWALLAVILIGAAVLALRARGAVFHWDQFFRPFLSIDWTWMTLGIAFMLFTYVVRAWRWGVMLEPLRPGIGFRSLLSATVIGFTAIILLGRPGELVRPYLIAKKEKVSFSSQMATWLLERILDTLAVLVIFGAALVSIPNQGLHLSPGLHWLVQAGGYIIAVLCAVCAIFLAIFRNFSEAFEKRILQALAFLPPPAIARIETALHSFAQGMQCTRTRKQLILLAWYSTMEWSAILAGYFSIFRACAATSHFGLEETLIFVGFVSLGSVVQIPGVGGGAQVAMVLVLTEIFHQPLETASGIAVVVWVIGFLSVVPVGLFAAFREGINWNRFKHLADDIQPELTDPERINSGAH